MAKTKSKPRQNTKPQKSSIASIIGGLCIVFVLLFAGYSAYWFKVAEAARVAYINELSKLAEDAQITAPEISGYPGKMVLSKPLEYIESSKGALRIEDLKSASWPFPSAPVDIETGKISIRSARWDKELVFDSLTAQMRVTNDLVTFEDSLLRQGIFEASVTGNVDISRSDVAIPDLIVTLSNHEEFLAVLVNSNIIEKQAAAFVGFGMAALMNNDTQKVEVPIYAKNGMINLGPLPVMKLPAEKPQGAPKRQKPVIPAQ